MHSTQKFGVALFILVLAAVPMHGQDLTTRLATFLNDLYAGNIGTSISTGVLAKDGTLALPSLSFAAETTNGFYRPSATNLSLTGANLLFATDNTRDLGAAAATRPRTGYFGTSVVAPLVTARWVSSGAVTSVANVGANSCGTTAATIVGTDNNGVITVGATSGTQCRVTFTVAAPVARDCTVTDSTTTIATRATAVTTTTTDFFGAFVAGDQVTYICVAR